jgi:hypothetical protein
LQAVERTRQHLKSSLLFILLFVAAFLVISNSLRAALPRSDTEASRAQLQAFEAERDTYDAIYIGSSHILHSIEPQIVDERLSRPGSPFRSYNLGADGMFSFESTVLLKSILDMNPARLRYVVLEVPSWRPRAGIHLALERYADWHNPTATGFALYSTLLADLSPQERIQIAGMHLGLAAQWLSNYGKGPRLWQVLRPTDSLLESEDEARLSQGYRALEDYDREIVRIRHQNFLLNAGGFLRKVDGAKSEAARSDRSSSLAHYNLAALEWQQRILAEADIELIYVLLPVLKTPRYISGLRHEGYLPQIFELQQPEQYPELYSLESRFDEGHLSRSGAESFSRILADQLSSLVHDHSR